MVADPHSVFRYGLPSKYQSTWFSVTVCAFAQTNAATSAKTTPTVLKGIGPSPVTSTPTPRNPSLFIVLSSFLPVGNESRRERGRTLFIRPVEQECDKLLPSSLRRVAMAGTHPFPSRTRQL